MSRILAKSPGGLLLVAIVGLVFAGAVWCCVSDTAGNPGSRSSSPLKTNSETNPSNGPETVEVTLAVSGMT